MKKLYLKIFLESDTTFGRGEGTPGLVDEEVEHDPETGLPFLRGRNLKGLLVEECANIIYALELQGAPGLQKIKEAAAFIFGSPGSTLEKDARLHVGAAQPPEEFRKVLSERLKMDAQASGDNKEKLLPQEVLETFTAVRRQTAVDENTGAPEKGSLRSVRVILRNTTFFAPLTFTLEPDDCAKGLLAASVLSLRRAGVGRNRGRGRLQVRLLDESKQDITESCFKGFRQLVGGETA